MKKSELLKALSAAVAQYYAQLKKERSRHPSEPATELRSTEWILANHKLLVGEHQDRKNPLVEIVESLASCYTGENGEFQLTIHSIGLLQEAWEYYSDNYKPE